MKLDQGVRKVVKGFETARRRLEREQTAAREAADQAIATLTGEYHLGLRDAGELLGLSHQRVHQVSKREAVEESIAALEELAKVPSRDGRTSAEILRGHRGPLDCDKT